MLDSETPDSLDKSTVVLAAVGPSVFQQFLAVVGDDPDVFFLTVCDLKYVLNVSHSLTASKWLQAIGVCESYRRNCSWRSLPKFHNRYNAVF